MQLCLFSSMILWNGRGSIQPLASVTSSLIFMICIRTIAAYGGLRGIATKIPINIEKKLCFFSKITNDEHKLSSPFPCLGDPLGSRSHFNYQHLK